MKAAGGNSGEAEKEKAEEKEAMNPIKEEAYFFITCLSIEENIQAPRIQC